MSEITEEQKPIEEQKPLTLTEKVDDIRKNIELITPKPKDKQKIFKLKWNIRSKLKKPHKTNRIVVHLLKINRNSTNVVAEIQDGMIKVNDKVHHCSTDFVYMLDGKYPEIILPEWSLMPIGTKDYYDAIENKQAGVDAQTVIIRAMERAEIESKKKLSGKVLIFILIGAAIIAYLFFANPKK